MKILNETKLTVVGKAEPTVSKDGNTTYYRIAAMQNGQATNLMVPEEMYHSIPDGLVDVSCVTSYDDRYERFRVESLISILSVNGRPYEKTAPAPEKAGGKQ